MYVEGQLQRAGYLRLKRIKEFVARLAEFKQIVADLTLENKAMEG